MQKLLFGTQSVVLFLNRREQANFTQLCCSLGETDALHILLAEANVTLPAGALSAEYFLRENRSILFVTALPCPEYTIFHFTNANNLIDAVRMAVQPFPAPDRSTLYEYQGELYLVLDEPYAVAPEHLCEFADTVKETAIFRVQLQECGRILAGPAAFTELSVRF